MFKAVTMNEFFFLPQLDLGRLWRWLKVAPVRPDNKAEEVVWIRYPGDDLPIGVVHRIPDGRLFYSPIEDGTGKLCVEAAYHLPKPSPDLTAGPRTRPPSLLGPEGDLADDDVKRLLIKSYYGKKAPGVLAALALA